MLATKFRAYVFCFFCFFLAGLYLRNLRIKRTGVKLAGGTKALGDGPKIQQTGLYQLFEVSNA